MVTLVIKLPTDLQDNREKIQQVLEALHSVIPGKVFSLCANVMSRKLFFSIDCEEAEQHIIENQLYSEFTHIEIEKVSSPLSFPDAQTATATIKLKEKDFFRIPTYKEQSSSLFAKLLTQTASLDSGDQFSYAIEVTPFNSHNAFWQLKRRVSYKWYRFLKFFDLKSRFLDTKINTKSKKAIESYEKKNQSDLYKIAMSIRVRSKDQNLAKAKVIGLARNLLDIQDQKNMLEFDTHLGNSKKKNQILLDAEEVATLWHLPTAKDRLPHILRILSKKSRPPLGLPTTENTHPEELVEFAHTNYRSQKNLFGIKTKDKARHMYVVGKSGSGKSKFLELLAASDIKHNRGFAVLDPHGDLVDNILRYIPEHRKNDVVVFDPTDLAFPVGFNPLEEVPEEYRQEFTNSFLEIFKKLFGKAWNARLEHVMRFCVLALLEVGNATVLSIIKLLTDRDYRQTVIKKLEDQTVKNFWTNEFAAWSEKFDSEAIMPILNKVAQFVSSPMIRNIVCQVDNKMSLNEVMDGKKILLVKLSKGQLGESNANLIGAMMITRIYQAAMQRSSIPEEQRVPFSIYIDEFQNFATDTFENILSEVRKYKLNITVAHQYMDQLDGGLRRTIFGNVANIISFRVGAEDANVLAKEYEPIFSVPDIMNLGVREMYLKMNIDGENTEAFSARSADVPRVTNDLSQQIIQNSQQSYAVPRQQVEDFIFGSNEDTLETIEELKSDEDFDAPII